MTDFVAQNWGSLASVLGLIFSFLAFIFSKRASKAALEARNVTQLQSLGQEMNDANKTAAAIVTYVGLAKGDMALLRTGELMNQTSYFVARWDVRLTEHSKNNLLSAREQLRSIHDVLTKDAVVNLTPRDRARLMQACQRVSAIYSEEYGTAVRAAETVGT